MTTGPSERTAAACDLATGVPTGEVGGATSGEVDDAVAEAAAAAATKQNPQTRTNSRPEGIRA